MDLSVNTKLYSNMGVDVNSVSEIANRILEKASKTEQQPTIQSLDLSKFNRNTLGINLYSPRTNVELQKQISQIQAGLYAKSIDIESLNSAAAQNLYSASTVQKNVELTQSIQLTELVEPKQIEKQTSNIELFSITDKHPSSKGFNPFNDKSQNQEK